MNSIFISRFPSLEYTIAEAVNTLCTNLSFAGDDVKVVMVTSCHASEGKSYLSMNMMRTMAGLGKNVILVDADLRRSQIVAQYGLKFETQPAQGLTHYLAGMCTVEDVIYSTNIENAYLLPAGRTVTSSLSLLTTPRFPALLHQISSQVDFVIVDAPPVGVIIDAAEIAKSCDGALFVVGYNQVSRRELLNAKRQIDTAGCKVLGSVLNNVELDSYASRKYYNKSYYSYYSSDYYNPPGKKRAPKAKHKTRSKEAPNSPK